jgi:hypothetical protein
MILLLKDFSNTFASESNLNEAVNANRSSPGTSEQSSSDN